MPITLRVIPNPFAHLDHEGQPAGTYPFDPEHAGGSRRWVGARIDLSLASDGKPRTRAVAQSWDLAAKATVGGRAVSVRVGSAPDQRTVYAFDLSHEGQPCPESEHYARGVRHGDIIAANAATAAHCGVRHVDPGTALRAAATKAIARWTAEQGAPPPVEAWPEALSAIGKAALEDIAKAEVAANAEIEKARDEAETARRAREEAARVITEAAATEAAATVEMLVEAGVPALDIKTTAAPAALASGDAS